MSSNEIHISFEREMTILKELAAGNKGVRNYDVDIICIGFDGTYNNEYKEDCGARPEVYQIPLDRQREVESLAGEATRKFNSCTDVCEPIGDIFKGLLEENGIKFHLMLDI